MDLLTRHDLAELTSPRSGHHVSLFIPTHRTWPLSKPDRICLEHMLGRARSELHSLGAARDQIRELSRPAEELLGDELFWKALGDGLAVFSAIGFSRSLRLPFPLPEQYYVGRRFMLKPLLALLSLDADFLVLALAQEQDVRLLRCSRHSAHPVELPQHPHNVDEATGFEAPQRGFAYHPSIPVGGGQQHAAVTHAVGVRPDDTKEELLEFAQQVQRSLQPLLHRHDLPLVLAGAAPVTTVYRKINTFPKLLAEGVEGAVKRLSDAELCEKAWPVVEALDLQPRLQGSIRRYGDAFGAGRASADLHEIIPRALAGDVATLFVASDVEVWGRMSTGEHRVEIHQTRQSGDEELLDAAAFGALRHKTEVIALPRQDMPDELRAAAIHWH